MRLTEKETNIIGVETGFYRIKKDNSNSFIPDNCGNQRELNSLFLGQQKLGQLEDIEEELGIDLLTLITALKNGIYVKNRRNEIRRVSCNIGLVETGGHNSLGLRFQDTNYKWRYLVLDTSRDNDIKDYGKTWALKKEELE